ncbi:polysaccharide deacetylase family protein [Kitasatospora sp. LaBMicrA B282]|uniref:polysaccharide deacetylase family protein n=1 Tax=Kitasatospora sp. LaBMicrA B282 TaxID=3420949 RepID=UPI003D1291D5
MSVPAARRTLLRRAAAGCVAALTLALACACGSSSPGTSADAAAHPGPASASASAGNPTAGGPVSGAPVTGTPVAGSPGSAAAATGTPAPAGSTAAAPLPSNDAPGTSIVYGTATGSTSRTVALTFDDGPGPATGPILDLLARYHAKATFCEIGPQATANPALVQRILAEGHRLCDHTVHHPQPMHVLSHDRQVHEIVDAKTMILKAGGNGAQVSWFRAPGGDFSADNRQIAVQNGLRPLGWTVDTVDWSRPGVPKILDAVHKELRPGGIILMHDGGGDRSQSVAALGQLLPWLVQQGYTFDFPAA